MRNYYSNEESADFLTATNTPTLLGINFWIVIFFKLYPESDGKVVSESKKKNIYKVEKEKKNSQTHTEVLKANNRSKKKRVNKKK